MQHASGQEDGEAQTGQKSRDEDDLAAVLAEVGAHAQLPARREVAMTKPGRQKTSAKQPPHGESHTVSPKHRGKTNQEYPVKVNGS